jgi:hypothetical protein
LPEDFQQRLRARLSSTPNATARVLYQSLSARGARQEAALPQEPSTARQEPPPEIPPTESVHMDRFQEIPQSNSGFINSAQDYFANAQDTIRSAFTGTAQKVAATDLRNVAIGASVAAGTGLLALAAISARTRRDETSGGAASGTEDAPPITSQRANQIEEQDLRKGAAREEADEGYRKLKVMVRGTHLGLGGNTLSSDALTAINTDISKILSNHLGADIDEDNSQHQQNRQENPVYPWSVRSLFDRLAARQ